MPKLIVFDVDGTILNSQAAFDRVLADYSRQNDLPIPNFKAIHTGYGDPDNHDFGWGVSKEQQRHHLRECFSIADKMFSEMSVRELQPLYERVEDNLKHLKNEGFTLAIVTSKPEAPLLRMLDDHAIAPLFATHRNWNDVERRGKREKPAPDLLQCVMDEMCFNPHDTVMIGDTTMDMQMGRAAKTHTIGVTWGAHEGGLLVEAGAQYIVDTHFDDVTVTIKKIFLF